MSRPKHPRATRVVERQNPRDLNRDLKLRAELESRLDTLRATIEAKRREGWTVIHSPAPCADQPV